MSANSRPSDSEKSEIDALNEQLKNARGWASFHGDDLIGDKRRPTGALASFVNTVNDARKILSVENVPVVGNLLAKALRGRGLDLKAGAKLIGALSTDSNLRAKLIESQVKTKYERMLHPPLTYLGDAFKYRTVDGKFNSALIPHLGQAGAPYAKTVPSKTHPLGALPDPGELFDRLMARENGGRKSSSGLSSMLLYHATIIIHDIFRTNEADKNISDTSSYLDLSPLYGFTDEMQRKVRDDKYKLGLLKPDTFAEDRLLRQPPGVCIMLVMYNRYHNYVATQLRRINENNRFSVPDQFKLAPLAAAAKQFVKDDGEEFRTLLDEFGKEWREFKATDRRSKKYDQVEPKLRSRLNQALEALEKQQQGELEQQQVALKKAYVPAEKQLEKFNQAYDAAWNKLDDDLFNTARLITCGMYIQVSIHDYLRALMGFHQYDTTFTLDPRVNMSEHKNISRGIGNQVTVEFNLLYRFHCAISRRDEKYAEDYIKQLSTAHLGNPDLNPKSLSLPLFMHLMEGEMKAQQRTGTKQPWELEFGLSDTPTRKLKFKRHEATGLFDDQQMINELTAAMDEPIANFGPKNVPKCMKAIEILGILQARKWEIGTLNDFRDFFGLKRHDTFESITPNEEVQTALRDLYEHPDKVELYPGVFCESSKDLNADPGPSDFDSALWAAIFSDAITLVRSDRFYTVDWNTNSLTTWGMKEVSPDNEVMKSSVFHRLLQRAFPEWYPFDSIRFFHPFYTGEQNAIFAQQQGYAKDFAMSAVPQPKLPQKPEYKYHLERSQPKRPKKPVILDTKESIDAVLADSNNLVHPARLRLQHLPPEIQAVLEPGREETPQKDSKAAAVDDGNDNGDVVNKAMLDYFMTLMRDIIKREFIVKDKDIPVYEIDVVKDFAIPVVTRYVADFLGFGDSIRTEKNVKGKYSENEIYQHITNCQVFLSYNADETKLMKRCQAFKSSMTFLYELTRRGNIHQANRWAISRWIFGTRRKNPMEELGLKTAQRILKSEDPGKAAAILLLIGLDSAYNSVLAFTSVLDLFLRELYGCVDKKNPLGAAKECDWLRIQSLAFYDDKKSLDSIRKFVLQAERASVRLPTVRTAVNACRTKCPIKDSTGRVYDKFEQGQTIICDMHAAEANAAKQEGGAKSNNSEFLSCQSSFTEQFAAYQPKHIAVLGLTLMIKVLAQMKNLRRGRGDQGRLKRVNLDDSHETYANYMAPLRMEEIRYKVGELTKLARHKDQPDRLEELSNIFDAKVLKPHSHTYLTPEWDEMVPFPTTWKVLFDGFGQSYYGANDFAILKQLQLPGVAQLTPPFYQPNGPSRDGGYVKSVVALKDAEKPAESQNMYSLGGAAAPLAGQSGRGFLANFTNGHAG